MASLHLLKKSLFYESIRFQTLGCRLLELFNFDVFKQSVKVWFSQLQFNTLLLLEVEQTLLCYLSLVGKHLPLSFQILTKQFTEFLVAVLSQVDC